MRLDCRSVGDRAVAAAGCLARARLASPAQAQGRLDARYTVTLAGMPIGKGAWVIDIAENQYTAAASGATAGLLRVFASGQGSGASRGHMVGGNLGAGELCRQHHHRQEDRRDPHDARLGRREGFAVMPPSPPDDPERVPVTEAHRRGVSDPMTALAGPRAGQRRSARAGGLPAHHADFRRPHALRSAVRLQAHGAGQGRQGLRGPGGGLRGLFRAGRRPRADRAGDQVSGRRSATWRSGWRRSARPACWCRSGSRSRRRSGMGVLQATQFVTSPPHATAGEPVRRRSDGACAQPGAPNYPQAYPQDWSVRFDVDSSAATDSRARVNGWAAFETDRTAVRLPDVVVLMARWTEMSG